jgi:hypothetical protein
MLKFLFPPFAKDRGPGYWMRMPNLIASRSKFRTDNSNEWRYAYGEPSSPDRSKRYSELLDPEKPSSEGFRFIILGDTGEGDKSQYSLIPLLKYLAPDFMIIIGDLANPAGRIDNANNRDKDDYLAGFFEPYRRFNIPIWSVPGNHEYYSSGQGQEYWDTFCTRKYAWRWTEHGLRFVPQPGTYWELKSPDVPLVVIGIDTGKSGKLDGIKRPWKTWPADRSQHIWLEERLSLADRGNKEAIVLLHIPILRKQRKEGNVKLKKLHEIIASHRSVKYVICGHEHNYELYNPPTFAEFMRKELKFSHPASESVRYVINGGGGSGLHSTLFKSNKYPTNDLFPNADEWKLWARLGGQTVAKLKMDKMILGRIVAMINKSAAADGDDYRYLSFMVVDVKKAQGEDELKYEVKPVWMKDLRKLFTVSQGSINITDNDLPYYDDYINDSNECIKDAI